MAKRILMTVMFTCLCITICVAGGLVVAVLALADPMPGGGISLENRSRDVIAVSTHIKTSEREWDRYDAVQQGESFSIELDHKDKDIRFTFVIVRSGSKGKKTANRYAWEGGNQQERLVYTDTNKLEEHKWEERLPLVLSNRTKQTNR